MSEEKVLPTKGGEFLIKETDVNSVFIPEEWDEEQKEIADACEDFLQQEVFTRLDDIDAMKPGLMESLLDKAGELGFLGISIPEEYEGMGLDFLTSMLTTEVLGSAHSFSVAILAHTGIGTLPLLYFGTKEQKEKYLPKLATGEYKAAYCLTEPCCGSDALSGKTKAVLSEDGKHYIINGQKIFITNAGFADLFTVFAKVDGEHFTAFLVEANTPGIELGEEEKKMGIKGSSTRPVFFNDVKVPVENVLGEIGKGHKIAFNILNIGRLKLGAATVGSSKRVVEQAVKYALERKQFGRPLAEFNAIKHKLAEMWIKIFASESATYRATSDIDNTEKSLLDAGTPYEEALLKAAQEYAAECAIMKVHGSEVLDFVVDEGVQIYGGYGYIEEYPMARSYRDARINRIFEGTNEINRMLSVDYILKKALKGELDLLTAAMKVQKELTSVPKFSKPDPSNPVAAAEKAIENFKKAILMIAGTAAQKYMQKLRDEQEILMNIADMLIETYVSESVLLRVKKLIAKNGLENTEIEKAMLDVYLYEAAQKINNAGKEAIAYMAEGDMQRILTMGLKRFTKLDPINTIELRRKIADFVIKKFS